RDGAIHSFSSYLAMGSALPMSIGMAVATSEPVLAIVGDGGLQMSIAEIATLAELRLPVTLLVVVDDAYGMLRDNGIGVGGSEELGVVLWNPDLHALCRAYDIQCLPVTDERDLAEYLSVEPLGPRMLVTRQPFG